MLRRSGVARKRGAAGDEPTDSWRSLQSSISVPAGAVVDLRKSG
jgi:hypothetical protein